MRDPDPVEVPAVELVTALLVAACVLVFGLSWDAAVASFFCATLVAVSVTDLERRIIPNRIVLPAAAIVLVAQTPAPVAPMVDQRPLGFLLLAALAYPAGMGMGDVKLALLLGVMLRKVVPVALMVGMVSALVPAVYLLAKHGQAGRKMGIPFGPFLALRPRRPLRGEAILDAYLGLL